MTSNRPGYDSIVPQSVAPAASKRKFKAYTSLSVAALNAADIDTCRRTLCECVNLNKYILNTFDNGGTTVTSIINNNPPTSTDVEPEGSVWFAFKGTANVGAIWIRCNGVWKFSASFKPITGNKQEPFLRALWNVKGSVDSYGTRQNSGVAFDGFPGTSYPNPNVCIQDGSNNCNKYNTNPLPGYDSHSVVDTLDIGDLNAGAKNLASSYNTGKNLGTKSKDNLLNNLGIVDIPIVIPSLPNPSTGSPGNYYPTVNGVKSTTAVKIPIQTSNFIENNPYISRFIQYKIIIPDGQSVPVEAVRFLFLNGKIVPWIQNTPLSFNQNAYNTPLVSSNISTTFNNTESPEGILFSGLSVNYERFWAPNATRSEFLTPTHIAMGFTSNSGTVFTGKTSPTFNSGSFVSDRITFTPTSNDTINLKLGTACSNQSCQSPYFKNGDIVVQYYSTVRGSPGIYADSKLFDTNGIAGYVQGNSPVMYSYIAGLNNLCLPPRGTIQNGCSIGVSGLGSIVHMVLLRFRPVAGVNVFQGGIKYTPNTSSNLSTRNLVSFYDAYYMSPTEIDNADGITWNLTNMPDTSNTLSTTSTNDYATLQSGTSCKSSDPTKFLRDPEYFNNYNPALPSLANIAGGFPGFDPVFYPPDYWKCGISYASKISINNFGISFYNKSTTPNISQQLGRGNQGLQTEILHPDDGSYIPLNAIKRFFESAVFIDSNNGFINYSLFTPYKGVNGTSSTKTLGAWLLDQMIDIQSQDQLPLVSVDPTV